MSTPKPKKRANNQAKAIITAACEVVAQQGVSKLTIESAAKQAGISKGGVLYHFSTKQALLEGMLDAQLTSIKQRQIAAGEVSKVSAMLNTIDLHDESERALSLAIIAAGSQNPELLKPAKTYFTEMVGGIKKDSQDDELASILLLALEGMRFLTMMKVMPWPLKETERILQRMRKLAEKGDL